MTLQIKNDIIHEDNPEIKPFLLNSTMVDDFVCDDDGGITIYAQHDSPAKGKEPNWLPRPQGPFSVKLRLCWPREEALDCSWQLPQLKRKDKDETQ